MKTLLGTWKVVVAIALVATAVIATVFASPASLFAASGASGLSAATPEPIVGFWYIKLTAKGNVPAPLTVP